MEDEFERLDSQALRAESARRRKLWVHLAALISLQVAFVVNSYEHIDDLRLVDKLEAVFLTFWAAAMLLFVVIGLSRRHKGPMDDILHDELVQSDRTKALTVTYWLMIVYQIFAAIAVYQFKLSALLLVYVGLAIGLCTPVVVFTYRQFKYRSV